MYSLQLNGFKTKQQAKEFLSWYEGQGEQDAANWFEVACDAGRIDVDWMPIDVKKKEYWNGDVLTAYIKV